MFVAVVNLCVGEPWAARIHTSIFVWVPDGDFFFLFSSRWVGCYSAFQTGPSFLLAPSNCVLSFATNDMVFAITVTQLCWVGKRVNVI